MDAEKIAIVTNNMLTREVLKKLENELSKVGITAETVNAELDEENLTTKQFPRMNNFRSSDVEPDVGAWKPTDTGYSTFAVHFEISSGRTADYYPSQRFPRGCLKFVLELPYEAKMHNSRARDRFEYRVDGVESFNYGRVVERIQSMVEGYENLIIERRKNQAARAAAQERASAVFEGEYRQGYNWPVDIGYSGIDVTITVKDATVETANKVKEILDFARTKLTEEEAPRLFTKTKE